MQTTPATTTASKALTARHIQIISHICITQADTSVHTITQIAMDVETNQHGTQAAKHLGDHAETPLASITLAHASACMTYVRVCGIEKRLPNGKMSKTEALALLQQNTRQHAFQSFTFVRTQGRRGSSQESEVLLWHFAIPQLNNILVWASRVSPLSAHKHPHLRLQVADGLHAKAKVRLSNNADKLARLAIANRHRSTLLVCAPGQSQGSATTQTSCHNLPQQASYKGQHHKFNKRSKTGQQHVRCRADDENRHGNKLAPQLDSCSYAAAIAWCISHTCRWNGTADDRESRLTQHYSRTDPTTAGKDKNITKAFT